VKPLQPLPDPDVATDSTPKASADAAAAAPPPVVVYQPPPPVVVVKPDAPPAYEYAAPPHQALLRRSEWGINLHIEGASIGRGTGGDASMGGAGLGLRFKPNRHFGIESDVDFVGGRDYQGDNRNETALSFNGLFFLNPQSHAQIYLLAGFGWSSAHVTSPTGNLDTHYGYFGGQGGVGLELRLGRCFALNADLRGFIRGRTDQVAAAEPEFRNADGRTTNTSAGALITGGATLYF
jgi:hypothetical protein